MTSDMAYQSLEDNDYLQSIHLRKEISDKLDKIQRKADAKKQSAINKYRDYIEQLSVEADGKTHNIYCNDSRIIAKYIKETYPSEYTIVSHDHIDLCIPIKYVKVKFYNDDSFRSHAIKLLKKYISKMKKTLSVTYYISPYYDELIYSLVEKYNEVFNEFGYKLSYSDRSNMTLIILPSVT